MRGLEIVTGGQRLHRQEDCVAAMRARAIHPAPFAGYLDASHTGGFAVGLGRWVQQVVGAANLRETTLFPRDLSRLVGAARAVSPQPPGDDHGFVLRGPRRMPTHNRQRGS